MEKQKNNKFFEKLKGIIKETKPYRFIKFRFWPHLSSFWLPWILLTMIMILIIAITDIHWKLWWLMLLMILFVVALVFKPMNIIHGLIGTRGNIRMFFVMFFIINIIFFIVYFYGFFKNAGITYDVSQPHVEFNIFEGCSKDAEIVIVENDEKRQLDAKGRPIIVISSKQGEQEAMNTNNMACEHLPANVADAPHFYHRIRRVWVLQNTLLTSLMQEPTEFYSFTCTYNGDHHVADRNIKIASGFHWFLVFHILISWIFLGVFISLIYQKFRNN